jgi:predicted DsbA family dithiol-disulfide isomerase
LPKKKFGSWKRAQATFRRVEELGEAAGLAFRFDRMEKAVNTTDAHRLVLWAGAQDADGQKTGAQQRDGAAHSVAEALFAAYFTEGRDVGDAATLAQVAAESGLSADAAREMLASERFAEAVEESQREARRLGVTGRAVLPLRRRQRGRGSCGQRGAAGGGLSPGARGP